MHRVTMLMSAVIFHLLAQAEYAASGPPASAVIQANQWNTSVQSAVWTDSSNRVVCSVSTNGGSSWSEHVLPMPNGCNSCSSPSCIVDKQGTISVAFVGSSTGTMNARGGVYVASSTNSGNTFNSLIQVAATNNTTIAEDPRLSIDDNPYSYHANMVYLTWVATDTRHDKTEHSRLMFARSLNGGATFMQPAERLNWLDNRKIDEYGLVIDGAGRITVSWVEKQKLKNGQTQTRSVSRVSISGGVAFGLEQ